MRRVGAKVIVLLSGEIACKPRQRGIEGLMKVPACLEGYEGPFWVKDAYAT
jgi:hypothetical protein